jgi:hypothetical protein
MFFVASFSPLYYCALLVLHLICFCWRGGCRHLRRYLFRLLLMYVVAKYPITVSCGCVAVYFVIVVHRLETRLVLNE